jgi:hypothetical protein
VTTPAAVGPALVNIIEIETAWGHRAFELRRGDLFHLDTPVDMIAVSVATADFPLLAADPSLYAMVRHTVLGALYFERGVDLAKLAAEPSMDLRHALSCWISERIDGLGRVLCIEDVGVSRSVEVIFDNIFAVLALLEAKGLVIRTFALPLLGAGGMGIDAALVMRTLLATCKRHLVRLQHLERVIFVERDPARAAAFDDAMDDALGRERVLLPRGAVVEGLRREILAFVAKGRTTISEDNARVLREVARVVEDPRTRSFEMGIMCRRTLERVMADLPGKRKGPLYQQIDMLGEVGVADWMRSYMHTLRIFGNESAHERDATERRPRALTERDLAVCLFCLERVLTFWLEK